MVTLHLWVSNQVEARLDCNCTGDYIEATGWMPPVGCVLDTKAQTLSGEDAETIWLAYRNLANAVEAIGHGLDDESEVPAPILTACPIQLIEERYTSAAESLARHESLRHETWAAYVQAVPSLRAARNLTARHETPEKETSDADSN